MVSGLKMNDDFPASQKTVFTLWNDCMLTSRQSSGSERCSSYRGVEASPSPKIPALGAWPLSHTTHTTTGSHWNTDPLNWKTQHFKSLRPRWAELASQWAMLSPCCGKGVTKRSFVWHDTQMWRVNMERSHHLSHSTSGTRDRSSRVPSGHRVLPLFTCS